MLPHIALDFGHLSIHQVAIPKALQDMKRGARPSIQKAQTNHIPVKKVSECPKARWQPGVHPLFDPALKRCLCAVCEACDSVDWQKTVFEIEQVDRLAASGTIVLVGPPGQRVEVVVDQRAAEICGRTGRLNVLVHPAVFAPSATVPEKPQDTDVKEAAEADQTPLKGHTPTAEYSAHLGVQARQPLADLRSQFRGEVLVRINTEDPVCVLVKLRQRPVELASVVDERMLDKLSSMRLCNTPSLVAGK